MALAPPLRCWAFLGLVVLGLGASVRADQVTLANGMVIRGEVDRDNSIVSIFDGLKRTMIRDSKIARTEPVPVAQRQDLERFALYQPLALQGGQMPSHALAVQATPWDASGQRLFQYSYFTDPRTRKVARMKQAINVLGPDYVGYRGIDGFWIGNLATSQVPRPVVLGLLGQVEQTNQNERLRVARFLIQAKWYPEALAELERLATDFPDLRETTVGVRGLVVDLRARQQLEEARSRRASRQPRAALAALKAIADEGLGEALLSEIDAERASLEALVEGSRRTADQLAALVDAQSPTAAAAWKARLVEVQQAIFEAPDLVERLGGELGPDDAAPASERLARAMSAWVNGPEDAVVDLADADALWTARDQVVHYLAEPDGGVRAGLLDALSRTVVSGEAGGEVRAFGAEEATRLIRRIAPPRPEPNPEPGAPLVRRVLDDGNAQPTEYTIVVPPEYHPLRSYPAVVVLNDGRGMARALEAWMPEAMRRGFILIAPDYMAPGPSADYRYTPDEHAAVQLAIRDARKRFAIDADRLFLAGSLLGGNAAWDIGLAHPDLFAGLVPISGLPAKYVTRTRDHAQYLPLYFAIGDLSTASTATVVFEPLRALIARSWDITYVEYARRGLEDLPEEIPTILDWMEVHRRTTYRQEFEVAACRPGDDRFWGVVVREFSPGRAIPPEAVDPLGKDLDPATIEMKTSTLGNLISLTVSGIDKLDLWLPPAGLDYSQKLQVRVNRKRLFNDLVKPDLGAMLEDVRLRGDRRQVYWARVSLGGQAN